MSEITLIPAKLRGAVTVPPSKSLAHRMIICAALADGVSRVSPIQPSQDVLAMLEGMAALGADCRLEGDVAVIRGVGADRKSEPVDICCRESGNTLRFLFPLSLTLGAGAHLTGAPGLAARPMTPYFDICERQGIVCERGEGPELSLRTRGRLSAGIYRVPGNISSQFITGLLLALSALEGDSEIHLTTPLESTAYVDLTLDAMRSFGVAVEILDGGYRVRGGQAYTARDVTVEGDYSHAANFLCAAALGSDVAVAGLNPDSYQGDRQAVAVLRRMGADVRFSDGAYRFTPAPLHGVDVDVSEIPDVAPVLALTCALAKGRSVIRNAGRLRFKECDRFAATVEAIDLLGGQVRADGDDIVIDGVAQFRGGCTCPCHNDHRMAMLYGVAATRCEQPITLDSRECVNKTYPGFWTDYAALGGRLE
ncbi:MAG: 3-phosphoshikimate 1-carboxyvinyltransferase [Clostridia bacterium]|nr:3-phosphoshikimate 1-carboxyvinyltransferase [Clostridia bacterium]